MNICQAGESRGSRPGTPTTGLAGPIPPPVRVSSRILPLRLALHPLPFRVRSPCLVEFCGLA